MVLSMNDLNFLWKDQPEYINLLHLLEDILLHSFEISMTALIASSLARFRHLSKKDDQGKFDKHLMAFFQALELPTNVWKDLTFLLLAKYVKPGSRTGLDEQLIVCLIMMLEDKDRWESFLISFCQDFEVIRYQAIEFFHVLYYVVHNKPYRSE